jgi:hypothetical protein
MENPQMKNPQDAIETTDLLKNRTTNFSIEIRVWLKNHYRATPTYSITSHLGDSEPHSCGVNFNRTGTTAELIPMVAGNKYTLCK